MPRMVDLSQIPVIAARRQQIAAERDALRAKIAELDQEDAELEVAARVLQRLGGAAQQPEFAFQPTRSAPPPQDDGKRPTVPDMINLALNEFHTAGAQGAEGQQILKAIVNRWGEVDPNHVRPALWRMVQAGRLIRKGDLYSLPKSKLREMAEGRSGGEG